MPTQAPTREIKSRQFMHNAHAIGFSGQITLPFQHLIEAQASCALPATGGYSSSRVDDFKLKDIVTCRAAYTNLTGSFSQKDNAYFTVTTSTIEGLDLLGLVKIGKLSGRIMCRHPYVEPGTEEARKAEPSIIPLGSSFEDVVIAGHPVRVVLYAGKAGQLDKYSDFRREAPQQFNSVYMDASDPAGPVHCSLVDRFEYDQAAAPELKIVAPNTIELDHFGEIAFAEFIVNPKSRRITMLHVDLGCGFEGNLSFGIGEGNGSSGPPPNP